MEPIFTRNRHWSPSWTTLHPVNTFSSWISKICSTIISHLSRGLPIGFFPSLSCNLWVRHTQLWSTEKVLFVYVAVLTVLVTSRRIDRWLVGGRKKSWSILRCYPSIYRDVLRKIPNPSVKVRGEQTGILSQYLQNTMWKRLRSEVQW
jgi:hypothetical protein